MDTIHRGGKPRFKHSEQSGGVVTSGSQAKRKAQAEALRRNLQRRKQAVKGNKPVSNKE